MTKLAFIALILFTTLAAADEAVKPPVVVVPVSWRWLMNSLPSNVKVIDISETDPGLNNLPSEIVRFRTTPEAAVAYYRDPCCYFSGETIVLVACGRDKASWSAVVKAANVAGRNVRLFLADEEFTAFDLDGIVVLGQRSGWLGTEPKLCLSVDQIGPYQCSPDAVDGRKRITDLVDVLPYDQGTEIVIECDSVDGAALAAQLVALGYRNLTIRMYWC
jgi:hypothetical protein